MFNIVKQVSAKVGGNQMNPALNTVNPSTINDISPVCQNGNTTWNCSGTGLTIGDFISRALTFLFPLAGLILFIMIIASGIQIAAAGVNGNKSLADRGKSRLTAAIIGFIITVSAYLIIMLIQTLLGIKILGF
jgi:hypothetical protein